MIEIGARVHHPEWGVGRVCDLFGEVAIVDFFGDRVEVGLTELVRDDSQRPTLLESSPSSPGRTMFRRAYEAVNLGVVPPHPDQLLSLSIDGDRLSAEVRKWLEEAGTRGLCKTVFGDYGSGKSHHLKVVEAAALKTGWVTAFVEFDPKQADPAKPHLVYAAIVSALRFPIRANGSQSRGFFDLVGEVRDHWDRVSTGKWFRESPWFWQGMGVLRYQTHSEDDQPYLDGVGWLGGQVAQQTAIRLLAKGSGGRVQAPARMPRTLESADIYVQHLVVINEWCQLLGYKGLLIILDEAEHVRGFNVNRRERANNFFDLLARCAHKPLSGLPEPHRNEHGIPLPAYWKRGPHFALVVALTEGETFADSALPLRDACVFIHESADVVKLRPPRPADFKRWCAGFLDEFERHYPAEAMELAEPAVRQRLAGALAAEYAKQPATERTLRIWVKLTTLVPSLLFANPGLTADGLERELVEIAGKAAGRIMPWEV